MGAPAGSWTIAKDYQSRTAGHLIKTVSNEFLMNPTVAQPPVSLFQDRIGTSRTIVSTHRAVAWCVLIASVVAISISGYLFTVALAASRIAGCGGSVFDCSHVINSPWSRWMGIPVSALALGMYSVVLVSAIVLVSGSSNAGLTRWAWRLITLAALSAGMAAVWFTSLQFFVIEHLCSYCLAAHVCGIAIALIIMWNRPLGTRMTVMCGLVSLFGFILLASGQILFQPPTYQTIEFATPVDESEGEIFEFAPPSDDMGFSNQ